MLTYASIDYSYFALAMSYDRRKDRDARFATPEYERTRKHSQDSELLNGGYGATGKSVDITANKDSFEKLANDLDKLFPERLAQRGQHHLIRQTSVTTGSNATTPEADFDATKRKMSMEASEKGEDGDTQNLLGKQ